MEDKDEQGLSIGRALDQILKNLKWARLVKSLEQSILRTHNLDSLLNFSNKERLCVVLLTCVSSLA